MRSTCCKSKSSFTFLLYHSLVKLLIDRPCILKERHNFETHIRKSFGEFLEQYGSLFLFCFRNSQVLMAALFLDIANNTCNQVFQLLLVCIYGNGVYGVTLMLGKARKDRPIECFHSRGQHLCKFIGTKGSVCKRKEFNSQRTGLGHQHGRRFIVLGHQYGCRDVM